jgi:hypothetical protein
MADKKPDFEANKAHRRAVSLITDMVINHLIWRGLLYLLIILVLSRLVFPWFMPTDDSDAGRFQRSDMEILTDHLTGCQYLTGSRGGLTPRLNADGTHRGCARG